MQIGLKNGGYKRINIKQRIKSAQGITCMVDCGTVRICGLTGEPALSNTKFEAGIGYAMGLRATASDAHYC